MSASAFAVLILYMLRTVGKTEIQNAQKQLMSMVGSRQGTSQDISLHLDMQTCLPSGCDAHKRVKQLGGWIENWSLRTVTSKFQILCNLQAGHPLESYH